MEILKLLDNSTAVARYDVLEFKQWQVGFYYKIRVFLTDETMLFLREYVDEEVRDYSFHWQDADNNLLIRWDNAPYHKDIPTFPHHKHIGDVLEESRELQVSEVLKYIETKIDDRGDV